ncbi:MAG: gamma-glutamyltransferase [Verrucomicrobiota bacterium]
MIARLRSKHHQHTVAWCLFLALTIPTLTVAQSAILSARSVHHPVTGYGGMVASQEKLATQAGVQVLREGGNAVDAAVTIGFTLAVTLPRAGNIGGGGFMLVYLADQKQTIAINYREKSPAASHRDLFLDENGNADAKKSRYSPVASGVPGTVYGLCEALEKYGTIPLQRALQPAIDLAKEGFIVTPFLANGLKSAKKRMSQSPAAKAVFYKNKGSLYSIGEKLIQIDLAHTLQLIADQGPAGFYQGETSDKLVLYMQNNGGLITHDDLLNYRPSHRKPISAFYRGHRIVTMPPPSSGMTMLHILKLLETFPLEKYGQNSAQSIHLLAEACRLAYSDRAEFLGDPDHWAVPLDYLLSEKYIKQRRNLIDLEQAALSKNVSSSRQSIPYESPETTHFSVIDRFGNAVANTYTLNFSYGAHRMAPGTGFLLNNEMDDFVSKPGSPNGFGLLGGDANAIRAGKRMASSMSPTIIFQPNGKLYFITGSPGGSRIITTVTQLISNVIDHKMNIAEASHAPRVHHQWFPDLLRIEKGLSPDTLKLLEQRGHRLSLQSSMGSTQSILTLDGKLFQGCSDPRRRNALTLPASIRSN